MSERPRVSVVVTNHNYGHFLEACLQSVFDQSTAPDEVIVVDDGSTDDSREILAKHASRVQAILQPNRGQLAALNEGCAAARGELVCLLDADDVWHRNKIEQAAGVFEREPRVEWLRHNLTAADHQLRAIPNTQYGFTAEGLIPPDPELFAERMVMASTSAIVVRRSLLERVLPISADAQSFRFDADALLLAGFAAADATGYSLPAALGFYRRHERQQFADADAFARLLERQVVVTNAIAERLGRRTPTLSAAKHEIILAAMRGAPLLSNARLGYAWRSLRWNRPVRARALAALVFALVAPGVWQARLKRQQGIA